MSPNGSRRTRPVVVCLLVLLAATCAQVAISGVAVSHVRPYFGFNAKGSKDTAVQTARTDALLGRITDRTARRDLVIRVSGGTISQTTSEADWTDAMIGSWVTLQRKYGVRFIYVVNGNDAPAAQAALIERWLDAGARFDFIEMMNEYYLPKFAAGDGGDPGVSRAVTPELYVNKLLPAYWRALDRFHLPYYLIFGPATGRANAAARNEHWNEVVARAVTVTYRKRDLNATVHLYVRGGSLSGYDYGQIDRLRASLPGGRHIAVTEAGILDPGLSSRDLGRLAVTHYRDILRRLRPGDYLLDQVLFSPVPGNNTADLDRNGITPKGTVVLDFIRGGLR